MTVNSWNTPDSSANGQLLIGNTGNRPSWGTLTQGSNTTITNGAGTISVAFSGGAGDFELISSATASSSAEITFTDLSATYDTYVLFMQGVQPATDNVIMYMQTSTNNGVSYDSGATDYEWSSFGTSDGGTIDAEGAVTTQISLAGDQGSEELGTGTNETLAMEVWIYKPAGTAFSKIQMVATYLDDAADESTVHGGGFRASAADIDAFRLYMSSGNISTGNFRLYGFNA